MLKSIKVTNYRSLVSAVVPFDTNLTALIGTNGAGKTNILKSILLFKRIFSEGYHYRRFNLDKQRPDEVARTVLEASLDINNSRYGFKAILYFDTSEGDDSIRHAEIYVRQAGKEWTKISNPEAFSFIEYAKDKPEMPTMNIKYLTRSQDLNHALFSMVSIFSKIKYYSATRFSNPTNAPVSIELEGEELKNSYSSNSNHEAFLYHLYVASKNNTIAYKRYKNTMSSLGLGLIDDITFHEHKIPSSSIKVLAGGHVKKINIERRIVIPSFTIDGLQLLPNQLSEGTFKTLALVFYLLNNDSDLLLIEEPEVCVHHGLLGSVLELINMQAKTKQIIISTHSDYVMDKLKPENIVVVRKDSNGTNAQSLIKSMPKIDAEALRTYLNESGNLGEYWRESGYFGE